MRSITWFARGSLFIIYFWFGFLKLMGSSPAEFLVHELFNITLYHLTNFKTFAICFGLFECFIAISWLIPKITFIAYYAVIIHVIFTFVPVIALKELTWTSAFTPTIIGQYIIKNILLLSCIMFVKENHQLALKEE
jgi:hypothetical protein